MTTLEKREQALLDYLNNRPNGAKEIAKVAIACSSNATLKKLCDALDIKIK